MMIVNPYRTGFGDTAPPPPRDTSLLSTIISGVVAEWDATIADSYSGTGQALANRETAPADSASQAAYDLYRGATSSSSSDDPTFNGVAGDVAAYFSHDGGDFFTLQASNTTFLNNLHKTTGGNAHTFVFAGRPAAQASTNQGLYGTRDGTNQGLSVLLGLNPTSNNKFDLTITHAAGTLNTEDTTITTANGSDHIIIVTYDPATRDYKYYVDTNTPATGTVSVIVAVGTPGTKLQIGSRGNGALPLLSGGRFKGAALLNKVVTDAEAQDIIDRYNTLYGW